MKECASEWDGLQVDDGEKARAKEYGRKAL
jgi:hypothetical protein